MGLGMRGRVWRPQLEALLACHRVLWFDHRGLGQSEGPPPPNLRGHAADLVELLEELHWPRAHLAGVSMGGMIAQELALGWGGRWRSLALLITSPGGPLHWVPPARGLLRLLRVARARTPEARNAALDRLLFPDAHRDTLPPERLAQRHADLTPPPPDEVVRRQVAAVRAHRAWDRLPRLCLPTLVIQAGSDRLVSPRHSAALARRIPGARLLCIPEAGHGLLFQCAAQVNDALMGHFAEHEG